MAWRTVAGQKLQDAHCRNIEVAGSEAIQTSVNILRKQVESTASISSWPICFPFTLISVDIRVYKQGRGNYFEVWGGGAGQTSPGVKGNPYPKLKTPRIWSTIFWEGARIHVQKQTKIKMNDIDSPKLGGRRPHSFLIGGNLPLLPPPQFPHPCILELISLMSKRVVCAYICLQGLGAKCEMSCTATLPI